MDVGGAVDGERVGVGQVVDGRDAGRVSDEEGGWATVMTGRREERKHAPDGTFAAPYIPSPKPARLVMLRVRR